MRSRLPWSVAGVVAAVLLGALIGIAFLRAGTGTGTVRAVIDAGATDRLVDVALIDASGQEYAGEDRGAGQAEALQLIPAGRVQVNVGTCSAPAVVRPGRTVVVRFNPVDCIR